MTFDPVAAAKRYLDAVNDLDFSVIEDFYAQDAVYGSVKVGGLKGRDAIMAAFRTYFETYPDQQAVDELTVEDNIRVVLDSLALSRGAVEDALTRALEFTGISAVRHRSVAGLNAFERRMTELARCVAGSPDVFPVGELPRTRSERP